MIDTKVHVAIKTTSIIKDKRFLRKGALHTMN